MTPSFAIYSHGWSIRFRPLLAPQPIAMNDNLRSVAAPLGNGRLLTASIERTRTNRALLAVSAFFHAAGTIGRGIVNFCRRLAGSSFLPFVHCSPKPTNGVSNRFFLAPISLPLLLTVHAPKHERSFLKCLTNALKGQSR